MELDIAAMEKPEPEREDEELKLMEEKRFREVKNPDSDVRGKRDLKQGIDDKLGEKMESMQRKRNTGV